MSTSDSDLAQALRAAAGIDDADVPRLAPAVITELANETVETIAWTYADTLAAVPASAPVSVSSNDLGALVRATEAGAPPVRGPAAWVPVRLRQRIGAHGRGYAALATALALAAAVAVTLTATRAAQPTSNTNTSVNTASAGTGRQADPLLALDADARKAAEQCISWLVPRGHEDRYPDLTANGRLLSEQRGHAVFTMLANDKGLGTCLTLDDRVLAAAGSTTLSAGFCPLPAATGVSVGTDGGSWMARDTKKQTSTMEIAGFAGAAVTGITVLRADGVVVTASMNDGLWAAWWPGGSQAVSVTVRTRDGHSQTTPVGKLLVVSPTTGPSAAGSAQP